MNSICEKAFYIEIAKCKLQVGFMFRTGAPKGLMLYMSDSETNFNYVSVSIEADGAVPLDVFPSHKLKAGGESKPGSATDGSGSSAVKFNDNKWHSVMFIVSKTSVLLVVDDYESDR